MSPGAEAAIFSALGDTTRLGLVRRLSSGGPRSVTELAGSCRMSRQALRKHLRVLERAGLVRARRRGRETRFTFLHGPVEGAYRFLGLVSAQWDESLARLKAAVEADPSP